MTRPRLGATLALAVVVSAALVVPSATADTDRATLLFATTTWPDEPRLVTLNGETRRLAFVVGTDVPTTVTATASGDGLVVADPVQSVQTESHQFHATTYTDAEFYFHVSATSPGVHSLTATFTTAGGTPKSVTMPYLVTPGSLPVAGTDSLAGLTYGWQGTTDIDFASRAGTRNVNMISFIDDRFVYLGLPPAGRPECTRPGHGCFRYAYDASTGLFRIGDVIVGRNDVQSGFWIDGWVSPPAKADGAFSATPLEYPLIYAAEGTRLAGRWTYRNASYRHGLWSVSLALHKNGTYQLSFRKGRAGKTTSHGSYELTRPGKIVFRSGGRVFSIGTLAPMKVSNGKPAKADTGLWLILSGRHGTKPDGDLLTPVVR